MAGLLPPAIGLMPPFVAFAAPPAPPLVPPPRVFGTPNTEEWEWHQRGEKKGGLTPRTLSLTLSLPEGEASLVVKFHSINDTASGGRVREVLLEDFQHPLPNRWCADTINVLLHWLEFAISRDRSTRSGRDSKSAGLCCSDRCIHAIIVTVVTLQS